MTSRGAYAGLCPKDGPTTLGERIQAIRAAWGWTQKELANRLNTEQPRISMYERDRAEPSKATIALLAEFFGITVEALADGRNFSIPDLPLPPPSNEGKTGPRVQLPHVEADRVTVVPLGNAQFKPLSLSEEKKLLAKISKKQCRAWIVIEEI